MTKPIDEELEPTPAETVLLTGFPAFTARRLAAHILARDPRARRATSSPACRRSTARASRRSSATSATWTWASPAASTSG